MGNEMINEIKRFASKLERHYSLNNMTKTSSVNFFLVNDEDIIIVSCGRTLDSDDNYKSIPPHAYYDVLDDGTYYLDWRDGNIHLNCYLSDYNFSRWMELKENMDDAKKGSM